MTSFMILQWFFNNPFNDSFNDSFNDPFEESSCEIRPDAL